jgi:hypothetical protein
VHYSHNGSIYLGLGGVDGVGFIICTHANMLKGMFVLLCGMYVGKHYPQYVPLPKISKECTDKVLKFLEELQKKESGIK